MKEYVFDIEADNLLLSATRMWILRAYDCESKKHLVFLEGDLGWKELFDNADIIVGHNIINYDIPLLKRLFNYDIKKNIKIRDTLILSQILDYKRFGESGHSLATWGEVLGLPKIEFEDFSKFSEEMLTYSERDVDLNVKIYEVLMRELKKASNKQLISYIVAEHAAGKWCADATLSGWPFDLNAAKALHKEISEKLESTRLALESKLGYKLVEVDKRLGEVPVKRPKWTKSGCYDVHTSRWFSVDPYSGYEDEERMIEGPYCRCMVEKLSLDSVADVKLFLSRNDWVPTQWNWKKDKDTGKPIKGAPKVTEDSLEFLGGDGALYMDFLSMKSRYGILTTWIENTDSNGRLHGECMVIGTPSMRARHSIIVNVPSVDKPYGKEMRSLFTVEPGWTMIGCDSSGNQARGLAHALENDDFIHTLLNGDIHQYNADILTTIVQRDLGRKGPLVTAEEAEVYKTHVVKRSTAKRILYAFLFGASGGKIFSYLFDVIDEEKGKLVKNGFTKAVPGFKDLIDKLNKIYTATSKFGDGYIYSIVGNKIYVDSRHKLLVYLLQSTEKITCAGALALAVERLEEEKIPYKPCIFYHDEIDFMVPAEFAVRAAEIGKSAFKDAPKLFGVNIMDGEAKIGKNWFDVH